MAVSKQLQVSVCLCVTLFLYSHSSYGETIKFKLSAKNLPNKDADGANEAIARVWKAEGDSKSFHFMGETETVDNNNDPAWNKTFPFRHVNGTNQRWRFFLKDSDLECGWPFEAHVGRAEIQVDDYVSEIERNGGNKPVELFLTHPTGGVLYVSPTNDDSGDNQFINNIVKY